ncbi:MAG: metalloregulator ArsR/SmtB family transcription factor [Bdellovibrionota bacterium]
MNKGDSVKLKKKLLQATGLLKDLANAARLHVLCELVEGEKSVTELVEATQMSQPHVSLLLARFRRSGVVVGRRKGKEVFYSLQRSCVKEIIESLWREFCKGKRERL